MKLLIDTHVGLWMLAADRERMSAHARELLSQPQNTALLSAASVWEVAIKHASGKLDAPIGFAEALVGRGAVPLPITLEHAQLAGALPPHHRDPFDRMLVAQAQLEGAAIVSADDRLSAYGVRVEW